MMIIDELFSANTLLISNALLLAAATIALLRFQRITNQSTAAPDSPVAAVDVVAREDGDLRSELVDQRILALQKIADELSRKEELSQRQVLHESPYDSAVQLVKCGASADELTRRCGLNKGEAQLMVRLHTGREREIPA